MWALAEVVDDLRLLIDVVLCGILLLQQWFIYVGDQGM